MNFNYQELYITPLKIMLKGQLHIDRLKRQSSIMILILGSFLQLIKTLKIIKFPFVN